MATSETRPAVVVAALLDAAADREPAMAALEAALARVRAADQAVAALAGVAPTDLVATIRGRAAQGSPA